MAFIAPMHHNKPNITYYKTKKSKPHYRHPARGILPQFAGPNPSGFEGLADRRWSKRCVKCFHEYLDCDPEYISGSRTNGSWWDPMMGPHRKRDHAPQSPQSLTCSTVEAGMRSDGDYTRIDSDADVSISGMLISDTSMASYVKLISGMAGGEPLQNVKYRTYD